MWAKYPKHKLVRERFQSKNREWNIHICKLALSPKPQIWWFHVVLVQSTTKICINMRAARAAWLFFPLLTNDIVLVNERVVDLKARKTKPKPSQHFNATSCNIVGHNMLHTLGHPVAICCDMLKHVGWCWIKFENGQIFRAAFWILHDVVLAWPRSRNNRAVYTRENRELKHARFWDADGNRKRTCRVPGQWCLPDFYSNLL